MNICCVCAHEPIIVDKFDGNPRISNLWNIASSYWPRVNNLIADLRFEKKKGTSAITSGEVEADASCQSNRRSRGQN